MSTGLIENELAFSKAPRVGLHVRNLTVIASKTESRLVRSFSLNLPSGSVMAVMGGSGSGKTTLLNVLASKISGGLHYEGDIHYILEDDSSGIAGHDDTTMTYLPQQDVLSSRLTCRETLTIAADLKLKEPKQEKARIVEQLLEELGLRDCAGTLVGDTKHRGLSGGEKRRLSIATQLIANPSIMFLDEPTTGLDAYSAFLLVRTLKRLAQKGGRTFIMSIHQPRSDILFLLDYVCILSRGSVLYCDGMENTIPYFASLGYTVPEMVNPADYFIDISSVDARSDESHEVTKKRLDELVQSWSQYEAEHIRFDPIDANKEIRVRNMAASVSFWNQVVVQTKRNIKLNTSDYVTLFATFAEPTVVGAVAGWIFYKPNTTSVAGTRTITASLYASVVLQCYLYLLFDTYRLCEQDIALYDRERAEGTVTPASFVTARKLSLFLTDDFLMILIFVTISYFMIGLEASAKKFFLHFSVIFLIQLSCSGMSLLSVAVSRDFSKASLVGNLSFMLLSLACGFFVNAKVMPVYVRWTKYISFTWYGFGALMANTFTDKQCTSDDLDSCEGNQLLETFGFPRNWRIVPLVILLCWCVGYYCSALAMFYIKKVDIALQNNDQKSTKSNKGKNKNTSANDLEISTATEEDLESKVDPICHVTVTLQDIYLTVDHLTLSDNWKGGLFHRKTKEILHSVNAIFKPYMINAIMGPSGSGKSSLLSLISGRLRSSVVTKFGNSGSIMFNGIQISEEMFKKVCSFVSQDDDHLLGALTVRETFKFAAALRLHHMTTQQQKDRVDDLIRALGLTHCQNNVIGSEYVKGVSGGERRRVTMGIQLLNDSPILLLDEPTSGLDSFTSATILEILENLCTQYGKTIIITIHQPRSELFKKFGNVLLLAKSGRTAFNGPPDEMVRYFSVMGYVCPEFTNVADFFLDLISINTQNPQNEIVSRERVNSILAKWAKYLEDGSATESSLKEMKLSEEEFLMEYGYSIRKPCNIALAYVVNVKRQLTTTRRNIDSLMSRIAQIPGVGILYALFWAPLKNDYTGISNRLGLTQESTALYFIGMLSNLACYPPERDYFYEEYNDNVYGIVPFFLAYMTLELPLAILAAFLYAIFTVLVCGLPRTAGNFFATAYCSFLIATCGESLGIMTNTLFERPGFVVNCISVVLSIGTQLSGLMSLQMSRVLKGINWLNPLGYTSMILINFAFPSDLKLTCDDGGQNPDGSCQFSTGQDVLEEYGLVRNTQKYLGIIICVAIIYRLLAYFILKAKLEWIRW